MYIYHINVIQRSLWQREYIYLLSITFRFKLKHHKVIQNICTCMYTTELPKIGPKKNYMPYLKAAKKIHDQFIYPVIFWGFWNFWGKKSSFLVVKIPPSSTGSRGSQSRGPRLKIRSSPPLQLPISEAMEPSRPSPGWECGIGTYGLVSVEMDSKRLIYTFTK